MTGSPNCDRGDGPILSPPARRAPAPRATALSWNRRQSLGGTRVNRFRSIALVGSLLLVGGCDGRTASPESAQESSIEHGQPPAHEHEHEHARSHTHPHDSGHDHAPHEDDHAMLHPGMGDAGICVCDVARTRNGWCDHCGVGYLYATELRRPLLFETIDPHGHEIGHESVTCASCQSAIENDDWCSTCRIGWRDGMGWMTRLSWALSSGTRLDDRPSCCGSCGGANPAERAGIMPWCGECGSGVVCGVRLEDRRMYDEAALRFGILTRAIAVAARCETCACAMMVDDECAACRLRYRDGSAITQGDHP